MARDFGWGYAAGLATEPHPHFIRMYREAFLSTIRIGLGCLVLVCFGLIWLRLGSVSVWCRFGLVRFDSVRFGSVRFGSVRFGSVRFGSVRFGSVRFGAVRCGSVRFGAVRCGSVRFGAVRFGLVRFGFLSRKVGCVRACVRACVLARLLVACQDKRLLFARIGEETRGCVCDSALFVGVAAMWGRRCKECWRKREGVAPWVGVMARGAENEEWGGVFLLFLQRAT